MKSIALKLISLSLILSISSIANANVINVYEFVENTNAWSYSQGNGVTQNPGLNLGSSETFIGSNGLEMTMSFYEDVSDSGDGGQAVNGYWGHGIGVIGADGSTTKVDNDGEAIIMSFSQEVQLLSTFFWSYGDYSDYTIFYRNANDTDWIEAVTKMSGNHYKTIGTENMNLFSNSFMIVNTDAPRYNDRWVLKGAAFAAHKVSEPGTIALLGLGLIGLAASRRIKA